jgi:phosphatidylglycerol---prolipoprotein diacylglyceryl transferase
MHPVLLKIGPLTFYTYGLIMAVGFIVGYLFVMRLAKTSGQDEEFYSNIFFWLMIFGILGAKALYLIVGYKDIANDMKDIVGCLRGGLVWYGGIIADLFFAYFYCRYHKKDFLKTIDTFASPAAVGLAIGRWGCLMAGCCYGKVCNLPWAIVYPEGVLPRQYWHIPVHPSPIYESIGVFVIAFICYEAFRRVNKKGVPITLLFMLYAPLRFGLEFLRGDVERGFLVPGRLSTSQFVSLITFVPALVAFVYFWRRPAEPEPKPEPPKKEKKKKDKGKAK